MKHSLFVHQVTKLEKAEQESAKKILELLDIKSQLSNRIRTLETDLDDSDKVKELEVTKGQLQELQQGKQTLEDKVGELQVRAGVRSDVFALIISETPFWHL